MNKKLILFLIPIFISCEKEESYPNEFNSIIGEWKAYECWESYGSYSSTNWTQLSMDSLCIDFGVKVEKRKLQIFNSNVLSSSYFISKISISAQNDSLINFRLGLRKVNPFSEISQGIIYHFYDDEIVLSSFFENSFSGVGYSYVLKRAGN